MSRRHGLGGAGGSFDAASWGVPERAGIVGPVCEAGDEEVDGLAGAATVLGFRFGGGAKLAGSRKEERGAAAWLARRFCGEYHG